ncbi:MAG: dolichyl-phosphate-mannose--protein mannosyltransferase, partial [Dermatophilaceae bacterium]
QPTDRLWGWLAPGLIALVGGILRFWNLARPDALVFDETYYVKQGYSMLRYGVEMRVLESLKKPDDAFVGGEPDVFSSTAGDFVVHPPVGKWVIAFGQWVFGVDSGVGWRFSVALLGTLSILVVGRVGRRLFGSTALGCIAAFLLAFEGSHFVMSRTGILDISVMFFALCAFAALLLDRDRSRELLAVRVGALPAGTWPAGMGPWLGGRPWRWVAGLSLGLCTGTKWSGLFFLAAFGLMTVWWDMGARRAAGVRHWARGALVLDGPFAAVAVVGSAAIAYTASWAGWFVGDTGYHRQWHAFNPGQGVQWLPPVLRNWARYHRDAYEFNTTLTTSHPYQSDAWTWMFQTRPTSFFYETPAAGTQGCAAAEQCSQAVNPIGTLTVWWVGLLALAVVLWWWLRRRDWRAGAIAAGFVGGWLPWFFYSERTIFTFYAVAFEPYVVLAIAFAIGLWVGRRADDPIRWRRRWWAVGAYLLVTLALFTFFWPVYTAEVVSYDQWRWRMWLPSWI